MYRGEVQLGRARIIQNEPGQIPEALVRPQSPFTRTLHALEKLRKDVAISFVAATLATITLLANPSPIKSESQANAMPETGSNPTTIFWGPGSENTDPLKIAASFAIVGLLATIAIEEIVNEDSNGNK